MNLMHKVHELKADPKPFCDVWIGDKTAEVRRNDRDFRAGEFILLRELEANGYTGRQVLARITHVQSGYGLPVDIVVLSMSVLKRSDGERFAHR